MKENPVLGGSGLVAVVCAILVCCCACGDDTPPEEEREVSEAYDDLGKAINRCINGVQECVQRGPNTNDVIEQCPQSAAICAEAVGDSALRVAGALLGCGEALAECSANADDGDGLEACGSRYQSCVTAGRFPEVNSQGLGTVAACLQQLGECLTDLDNLDGCGQQAAECFGG